MQDDRLLKQLNQLFDNKLTPITEELGETNRRVEQGFASVHGELKAINARLDTVAGHLAEVDERLDGIDGRIDGVEHDLKAVIETQEQHSEQLGRIERRLTSHDNRLDTLEAKTAHLPTPPRG